MEYAKNFEGIQYRDRIKNKYCDDNNIYLIRIPYYDLNKINEQYIVERLPNVKSNVY